MLPNQEKLFAATTAEKNWSGSAEAMEPSTAAEMLKGAQYWTKMLYLVLHYQMCYWSLSYYRITPTNVHWSIMV